MAFLLRIGLGFAKDVHDRLQGSDNGQGVDDVDVGGLDI